MLPFRPLDGTDACGEQGDESPEDTVSLPMEGKCTVPEHAAMAARNEWLLAENARLTQQVLDLNGAPSQTYIDNGIYVGVSHGDLAYQNMTLMNENRRLNQLVAVLQHQIGVLQTDVIALQTETHDLRTTIESLSTKILYDELLRDAGDMIGLWIDHCCQGQCKGQFQQECQRVFSEYFYANLPEDKADAALAEISKKHNLDPCLPLRTIFLVKRNRDALSHPLGLGKADKFQKQWFIKKVVNQDFFGLGAEEASALANVSQALANLQLEDLEDK